MPVINNSVTPEDLDAAGWEAALDEARRPTVDAYASAFKALSDAHAAESEASVLTLLGAVCYIVLAPSRGEGPFAPMYSFDGLRAPVPEDLSDEELGVLEHLLTTTDDVELQARMADILWIRRRQHQFARQAVDYYVSSAERLEGLGEYACVPIRLERANQLAPLFGGQGGELLQEVLTSVAAIVRNRRRDNVTGHTLPLLDLLHDRGYGEPQEWAQVAQGFAEDLEMANEFHPAQLFWARAARAYVRASDEDAQRTALIREAETYVKLADEHTTEMGKTSLIRKAFEAYRQIPGTEDRRRELHERLLGHQKESLNEMGTISTPIDFGSAREHARAQVQGRDLLQALYSLALLFDPIKPDQLRKQTIESARQTPFLFYIPSERVNAMGRVVGVKPGGWDNEEGAIRAMMHDGANRGRDLDVKGLIVPALQQIRADHPDARLEDLEPLVRHNAFVPPDRQMQFAKGLLAGIRWDFIGAAHLLIPQVENSLRVNLQRMGMITTGLDSTSRRQNEQSLNVTLIDYEEQLEQVFGEDVVFELRSLLIEPLGANLRNEAMHGLMSDGAFFSSPTIYLWWLILRLCCLGNQGPLPEGVTRGGGSAESDESAGG